MSRSVKSCAWFLSALAGVALVACVANLPAMAQEDKAGKSAPKGSLQEDLAARKLLQAGDARYDADEQTKAVEVWQSVIERYPRSKVRHEAHLRLGNYLLDRERAYDRARTHFEAVASTENPDDEQRALATLRMGICFYEARNYGKCFTVMREVIEKFPVSEQVNQAYYYIGLGHFQLGHYSRAISSLEKVGTALSGETNNKVEKVEAGKRLFIKIEDADLSALEANQTIKIECSTSQGDKEIVECLAVGRNVRVVLGSIPTALGKPKPGNNRLEVKGDDTVSVSYVDSHTADRQFNRPVIKKIQVVGDGIAEVLDGAYQEKLRGVVLGRGINVQVTDPDRDLSDKADTLKAIVEVYREKSTQEIDAEEAALAASGKAAIATDDPEAAKINRLKVVDKVEVTLTEAKVNRELVVVRVPRNENADPDAIDPATGKAPENKPITVTAPAQAAPEPDDGTIHSGVFRALVPLVKAEQIVAGNDTLEALPNDIIQITYIDERNMGDGNRPAIAKAGCVEGNLGGVRVTRAEISDQELRVKTLLKTASALTNIGNRYKEFGLKKNADAKYAQALIVCEDIMEDARRLGGRLLEETYVQLWQIYYEMDKLEMAATMSQRLQREFPNSEFVDDALLKLAEVVRKQGDLNRAIGIYTRLVATEGSQLRGEGQFGIAECYEQMARAASANNPAAGAQQMDRAFNEYKKVFDNFPESGRVGEAVAKMAEHYVRQKDYARAIDIFESVLNDHPDAKFLDVILFHYGGCLVRLDRKAEARKQFDQLIADFPESPLAANAKKIVDALVQKGF